VALFLAECYLPGLAPDEGSALLASIGRAAAAMAERGVVALRTLVVPGDAVCLVLYEASTCEAVEAAMTSAGLPVDRVVAALAGPQWDVVFPDS
jgi:hypothetical protein